MKMVFSKEGDECKVSLRGTDGSESEFSYIKLIDMLYDERKLEEAEFGNDFTDEEKDSIGKLVFDINNRINDISVLESEENNEDEN